MFRIKRLDTFMLQRFVPLLVMTFFIVIFILMMQYLFRMVDDLVGKGLSFKVLGELFFYAALTMVPMALPLSVLLAALMVFGNLGEKLELTAMKAAGISLFRIMRPLIVLMIFIAVGTFFFQNYIQPIAESKMWTLMFSVRQKSPEVEIPERSFYNDIPGMNLYVEKKNPETGMLYQMIMYDLSQGSDKARVIVADSGKFSFTEDKTKLFLHIHSGEMFENLADNSSMGMGTGGYMPFRRETFADKRIYFNFDANFNRMDEEGIRSQYVGQNVVQLRQSIDSLNRKVDSIGGVYARDLQVGQYAGTVGRRVVADTTGRRAITVPVVPSREVAAQRDTIALPILDSVFAARGVSFTKSYIQQAISDARRSMQDYEYRSLMLKEQGRLVRMHGIQLNRKFTYSLAVLVFFFIGAPLGAIIKKGGIGTPLVISVFLFIIYYIFDNAGYKMARDGKMIVWQGVWLSTVAMLPLGIYFTVKAVKDSTVFNADTYVLFFQKLIGRHPARSLELKQVIMTEVDPAHALALVDSLEDALNKTISRYADIPAPLRRFRHAPLRALHDPLNELVDYLSNTTDKMVISLLNKYPFEPRRKNLASMLETTRRLKEIFNPAFQAAPTSHENDGNKGTQPD